MSLVPLTATWPPMQSSNGHISVNISNNTDRLAFVVSVPKTGQCWGSYVYIQSIAVAGPVIRYRFETVDVNGAPTGTLAVAGAEGTFAPTSIGGWGVWFDSSVTLTRGQIIAIVFDMPTGSGSFNIARGTGTIGSGFPYMTNYTTSWAKNTLALPITGLEIDNEWIYIPGAITGATGALFVSSTGTAELGNRFTSPFDATVRGLWFGAHGPIGSQMRANLYDIAGNLLASSDVFPMSTSSGGPTMINFSSEITINKDQQYRITGEILTSLTSTHIHFIYHFNAGYNTASGRGDMVYTSRPSGGSFSDTAFRTAQVGLVLSEIQDTAQPPPSRHKIMVGGQLVDVK